MAGRSEISQTLKFKGMRNCQESKKLSSSVDRFKKEYEKKLRELSVQQSVLLESQKRRESRRRSLPSTVDSKSEDEMRSVAEKILQRSSLSDSALDQYAKGLRSGLKGENKSPLLTSPLLKLPSITIQKDAGTGKIELEDVTSIKTPKKQAQVLETSASKAGYTRFNDQAIERLFRIDYCISTNDETSAKGEFTSHEFVFFGCGRSCLKSKGVDAERKLP